MKKFLLAACAVFFTQLSSAQKLSELMRPLPAAVSAEADMPAEMAQKFEGLKKERQLKYTTAQKATSAALKPKVQQLMAQYLTKEGDTYQIKYNAADKYRIFFPKYKLLNTSHGRRKYDTESSKAFNVKKDRLSNAIILNNNEIYILNKKDKQVDMTEFVFETNSDAIAMEGNKIILKVPVLDLAAGKYPWVHKVVCRHTPSNTQYTFDIETTWNNELNQSGSTNALVFASINNVDGKKMALLCDLESHNLMVVKLPLLINGEGVDGANGRKGSYGANGINQSSYTDKDGKTHTIAGTCAKPGQDGQDGGNGTNGGHFLICLTPDMIDTYGLDCVVTTIDGGKGGKGGKGGEGGIHGKGSGCTGKAPDGKDGKDGVDGIRGDFLYVNADCLSFFTKVLQ